MVNKWRGLPENCIISPKEEFGPFRVRDTSTVLLLYNIWVRFGTLESMYFFCSILHVHNGLFKL